jgi:uncharacterized protein
MKRVFVDTCYLIALINPKDDCHKRAKEVSEALGTFTWITSEMVLTELLNYFSAQGKYLRQISLDTVDSLRSNLNVDNVDIVPQTSEQFERAREYYRQRMDKGYSLTDCASMLIMQEQGIQDVLTYDHHFQQAGFSALLRDD